MDHATLLVPGGRAVRRRVLALVLTSLGLAACTDGPAAVSKPAQVLLNFLTPATVRSVVVEVSGPGVTPSAVLNIPVGSDSVARGTLTLTAGAGRRFVMSAFDSAGVATHRADTTIALVAGANTPLAVRLTPLASTLGITVTFGGTRVTVADTSTRSVSVGDTVRITAAATRPNGTALPVDSLEWGSANPAIATVAAGLVRAVRPGETFVTVSRAGATARVAVVVRPVTTPATPSASLAFNGASTYLAMSQSMLGGATVANFSIEFWIKNGRPNIDQHLGTKAEFWKGWGIAFGRSGKVGFYHEWPNTYYVIESDTGVMRANQWQHVAIVGAGTQGTIYVDGAMVKQANVLRGEISFNAVLLSGVVAAFSLGHRENSTLPDDLWFQGELSDFRVWDRALSAADVRGVYLADPATNASGLRHWMPLAEGTGTVARDIVGGLQAQVVNPTWKTYP